jgi:hypothetical protein
VQPLDHERLLLGASRAQRRAVQTRPLVHDETEVDLGPPTRAGADDCKPAERRQARDVLGQVDTADELENHVVLALRLGRRAKRSHALGVVAGGAGHLGAERDAELNGRGADAAGGAVDEETLARQEERLGEQRVVRGRERLHEPARRRPVHELRDRQGVPRVGHDQLGLGAAAEQCEHAFARIDDLAGTLEPWNVDRHARRWRVKPGALHQVGVVDPGGVNANQQLALARHGIRPLLDHDLAVTNDRSAHLA